MFYYIHILLIYFRFDQEYFNSLGNELCSVNNTSLSYNVALKAQCHFAYATLSIVSI